MFLSCSTVGTWAVHSESCWGAQGTEEKRCPEIVPGNPEWGDWCILRHSGLSPLCEESLTKDQRSHPAKSCRHGQPTVRPRVGRGGCWEGHGKHLLWCFSRLQSQVGGKGCSLASSGLSAATPTFGKNSWLNQPDYSHRRNSIVSSTILLSNCCLMLPCLQEVWIPQ